MLRRTKEDNILFNKIITDFIFCFILCVEFWCFVKFSHAAIQITIRIFDLFPTVVTLLNNNFCHMFPTAAHLFNLGGTKWKNLRAKISPTFTSGKLKGMFQTLVDCSLLLEKFIKEHDNREPIDIKYVLSNYTVFFIFIIYILYSLVISV